MMRVLAVLVLLTGLIASGARGIQQVGSVEPDGAAVGWPPGLPASVEAAALILESEDRRYAAEGLLDLTMSPDTETRSRAALALGRVGSPRLLSRLIELTRDPETVVRAAAAFGLGRLEYGLSVATEDAERVRARDALLTLIGAPDGLVAEQAAWALGMVDGGAATAVADWLRHAGQGTPETRPRPAVLAAMLTLIVLFFLRAYLEALVPPSPPRPRWPTPPNRWSWQSTNSTGREQAANNTHIGP